MAEWHTVETARDEWPGAPTDYGDGGDDSLVALLAVAKEAVIAYAPAVDEELTDIPEGYRVTTRPRLSIQPDIWQSAGSGRVYYFGFAPDR